MSSRDGRKPQLSAQTPQQQGRRGKNGETPAQKLGAKQHSPAREACLLPCQGGWGWELRLGLRSDPRERTGVGGVNTA